MVSRACLLAAVLLLGSVPPAFAAPPRSLTGLRPAIHVAGNPVVRWTLTERMRVHGVPGVSVAVLRGGQIAWAGAYGVRQAGRAAPVTTQSMFSVGSLSKVATAAIVLRLVDAKILALDTDVNRYLKRWRVPPTDGEPVTLRRLLSHTAGMSVSGFPDYQPGAASPTLIQTLNGEAPAQSGAVRLEAAPGSRARYSGGGVMVEQLVIEDALGIDFETAARRYLFEPLGMQRSTFAQPLDPKWGDIAMAHGPDGKSRALPRGYETMPETAASGLWTTAGDYARLVLALLHSYRGGGKTFLSSDTARQMMEEVSPGPVGLGPFLRGRGLTRQFFHAGSNDSYRAWMQCGLATGDGIIVLTNGTHGVDLYPEIRRAVAAREGWQTDQVLELPQIPISPTRAAALSGRYRVTAPRGVVDGRIAIFPQPSLWQVTEGPSGLLLLGEGHRPIELIPADQTNFVFADDPDQWVEFVADGRGGIDRLILRNGLSAIEAIRE